ncbi:MAG: hypothetical protein ACKPGI_14150, partial [Verrucomicrobiota bacterium]
FAGGEKLSAGCPQCEIEALTGTGSVSKLGFSCGSGCDTKYYRTSNANTLSKCDSTIFTRNSSPHANKVNRKKLTVSTVGGSNFSFNIKADPANCASTVTLTGTADSTEVISQQQRTWNYTDVKWENSSCRQVTVTDNGQSTVTGNCSFQCPNSSDPGYTQISSTTTTDTCGVTSTTTIYNYQILDAVGKLESWGILKETSSSDPGYQDEYTTKEIIDEARQCAETSLNTKSFDACGGCGGSAIASLSLNNYSSTASCLQAKWRIKITGTTSDDKLKITLKWVETINGKSSPSEETRFASGSDQTEWYYPGKSGEPLEFKESEACSYSYSKALVGVRIEVED